MKTSFVKRIFPFLWKAGCKSNWNSVILWGNQRLQYIFVCFSAHILEDLVFAFFSVQKKFSCCSSVASDKQALHQRKQLKKVVCFHFRQLFTLTLVYRIDVQDKTNVQVGKFLKNIKHAGQNKCAGGEIFFKNIKRAGQNRRAGGKFGTQPC